MKLQQHFENHGHEFGLATANEYLAMAERFLNGPMGPDMLDCERPQGGYFRYDTVTDEYGAIRADGFIATYMIPDPLVHGLPTNLDYFESNCAD